MKFRYMKRFIDELIEYFLVNLKGYKNSKDSELLNNTISLKNKYKGERLFIFFSGVSIKKINLDIFNNEYTMATNYFVLHYKFKKLNFDFYSMVASWNMKEAINYEWLTGIVYNKVKPEMKIFLHSSSHSWLSNIPSYKPEITYYVSPLPNGFPDYCNVQDSMKGVFTCSISLAIHMGFKEIYLVGSDYTKSPQIVGHFYDGEYVKQEPTKELLEMHTNVNEYAKKNGVKIFNIIEDDFKSPIFEGININDIYALFNNQNKQSYTDKLIDRIDALVFDFDGVLTDNLVYVDQNGNEQVCCNRGDGLAFDALRKLNIKTFIISTETNSVVAERAKKLKIPVQQGIANKLEALISLAKKENIDIARILYVGNDLNDLEVMKTCGLSACPADSHERIKEISRFKLKTLGGKGLVRELVEDLLKINIEEILYKK